MEDRLATLMAQGAVVTFSQAPEGIRIVIDIDGHRQDLICGANGVALEAAMDTAGASACYLDATNTCI